VVLVTGGAGGIGRAAAEVLADRGATVVVVDRDRDGGAETVAGIERAGGGATLVVADVSNSAGVQAVVEETIARHGRIDGLVNNAAIVVRTPLLAETDERDWDLVMDTNLKSVFLCTKYCLPHMLAAGGGSIVNVASVAALVAGQTYSTPYGVSKAGVVHLTRLTAVQYASAGIRANCVLPGSVDTAQLRGSTAGSAELLSRTAAIPLGRIGRPEDIAPAIAFLIGDESGYVTGATLVIDGGRLVAA
jgi:NAD(P)-dependent dehydrogenase (short-subunit alcohol dehydrogenase family)